MDTRGASDYLKGTLQHERRAQCQQKRQEIARVCRDYLEKSFKARIDQAQKKAMSLAAKAAEKPEYSLAAAEARRHAEDLERLKDERIAGVRKLGTVRTGPVRHLASAVVRAAGMGAEGQFAALADEPDPAIKRKTELKAEDIVVADLVAEGYPEDRIERVGASKPGFDIRAQRVIDERTGATEVRRIEVKGRKRGQPIRLTPNEWIKAHHLASTYWLYVVWDPLGNSPQLDRVENPAARLDHAKREVSGTRFFEIPAAAVAEAAHAASGGGR